MFVWGYEDMNWYELIYNEAGICCSQLMFCAFGEITQDFFGLMRCRWRTTLSHWPLFSPLRLRRCRRVALRSWHVQNMVLLFWSADRFDGYEGWSQCDGDAWQRMQDNDGPVPSQHCPSPRGWFFFFISFFLFFLPCLLWFLPFLHFPSPSVRFTRHSPLFLSTFQRRDYIPPLLSA